MKRLMSGKPKSTKSTPSIPPQSPNQIPSSINTPSGSKVIPIILGVIAAAIIAIGAYALGTKQTQSPIQNIAQTTPIPSPTPNPTANWKTYVSRDNTYSIKYPSDWYLYENTLYSITISDIPDPKLIPTTFPEHTLILIDRIIGVMPTAFPYAEGSNDNPTIKQFSINSYTGIRGNQKYPWGLGETVYLDNNKGEQVTLKKVLGDNQIFNQILSTFNFTEYLNTSNWKTYTNKVYDYSLRYPENWYVTKSDDNTQFILTNFDPTINIAKLKDPHKFIKGDTEIEIDSNTPDVIPIPISKPITEFNSYQATEFPNTPAIDKVDYTSQLGDAVGLGISSYYFEHKGYRYHLREITTNNDSGGNLTQMIVANTISSFTLRNIDATDFMHNIPTDKWQTYKSSLFGFSLKYPCDFICENTLLQLPDTADLYGGYNGMIPTLDYRTTLDIYLYTTEFINREKGPNGNPFEIGSPPIEYAIPSLQAILEQPVGSTCQLLSRQTEDIDENVIDCVLVNLNGRKAIRAHRNSFAFNQSNPSLIYIIQSETNKWVVLEESYSNNATNHYLDQISSQDQNNQTFQEQLFPSLEQVVNTISFF